MAVVETTKLTKLFTPWQDIALLSRRAQQEDKLADPNGVGELLPLKAEEICGSPSNSNAASPVPFSLIEAISIVAVDTASPSTESHTEHADNANNTTHKLTLKSASENKLGNAAAEKSKPSSNSERSAISQNYAEGNRTGQRTSEKRVIVPSSNQCRKRRKQGRGSNQQLPNKPARIGVRSRAVSRNSVSVSRSHFHNTVRSTVTTNNSSRNEIPAFQTLSNSYNRLGAANYNNCSTRLPSVSNARPTEEVPTMRLSDDKSLSDAAFPWLAILLHGQLKELQREHAHLVEELSLPDAQRKENNNNSSGNNNHLQNKDMTSMLKSEIQSFRDQIAVEEDIIADHTRQVMADERQAAELRSQLLQVRQRIKEDALQKLGYTRLTQDLTIARQAIGKTHKIRE